jgi:hypothetical protein
MMCNLQLPTVLSPPRKSQRAEDIKPRPGVAIIAPGRSTKEVRDEHEITMVVEHVDVNRARVRVGMAGYSILRRAGGE